MTNYRTVNYTTGDTIYFTKMFDVTSEYLDAKRDGDHIIVQQYFGGDEWGMFDMENFVRMMRELVGA